MASDEQMAASSESADWIAPPDEDASDERAGGGRSWPAAHARAAEARLGDDANEDGYGEGVDAAAEDASDLSDPDMIAASERETLDASDEPPAE